jgi:hypothetical protein
LHYACKLVEKAGVSTGWARGPQGLFLLVIELSCGDLVFSTFNEAVGNKPFLREPVALRNNSFVLARTIAQTESEEKKSALRRSTRIAANMHVQVESVGFAYTGETMTVNAHGALLSIPAPLALGNAISLRVPHTGQSVPATVVFTNRMQIGIELNKPGNIWGVRVPPPDWEAVPSEPFGAAPFSNVGATGSGLEPDT